MVVYDLQCAQGHAFEGWFEGLEDLEGQIRARLITCPVCGLSKVQRVPSGFGIARRRGVEPDHEVAARLLGRALQRYLRENFDDVGAGFAKEALKIHYGVSEARNIRGVSTPQEEEVLKSEGVSFFKVGDSSSPSPPPAEGEGEGEEE
ncbi:MAG: DUF1178 family protein [Desulfarculus sp.]|nr:DUF1178 family protein [Desulfarculus sp.]